MMQVVIRFSIPDKLGILKLVHSSDKEQFGTYFSSELSGVEQLYINLSTARPQTGSMFITNGFTALFIL